MSRHQDSTAVALQQAVQVGPAAAFTFNIRLAVFVLALLQDADHVMVTERRRFIHRRAPPPCDESKKNSLNNGQNQSHCKIPLDQFRMFDGQRGAKIFGHPRAKHRVDEHSAQSHSKLVIQISYYMTAVLP